MSEEQGEYETEGQQIHPVDLYRLKMVIEMSFTCECGMNWSLVSNQPVNCRCGRIVEAEFIRVGRWVKWLLKVNAR